GRRGHEQGEGQTDHHGRGQHQGEQEPQDAPPPHQRTSLRAQKASAQPPPPPRAGRDPQAPPPPHQRTSLRAQNASAKRPGPPDSTPRSRSRAQKVSSLNQERPAWLGKPLRSSSILRWQRSGSRGTNRLGWPRSPSYLGISYSKTRWPRKVFQVSSATSRWSWGRSSSRGGRSRSGSTSALSRSKRSFTAAPS